MKYFVDKLLFFDKFLREILKSFMFKVAFLLFILTDMIRFHNLSGRVVNVFRVLLFSSVEDV